MRVLVCGGRLYTNTAKVCSTLDAIHAEQPIDLIIEGGASGADQAAYVWARDNKITCQTFLAYWELYGNYAGPERNARMIFQGKPDKVLAFPGGRGTADMKARAYAALIPVIEIKD